MYLPALDQHPGAVITAICGRNKQAADEIAARWKIPHVFTDYEAMLGSGLIDAVVVSTINDSHYPITMAAIEKGLHVLCEKPLALTYADAQRMADAAEAKGICHMVPFTYRFMPTSRYIKELIDEGYIGRPYHLNMRFYAGYARDGEYLWRFDVGKAGSGVIGDLGSHYLYLARWFFGEIESVSCQLGYLVERPKLDPNGMPYELGDDNALMTLTFENGAQGLIHVTALCYEDTTFQQSQHMDFHGANGTLYCTMDTDEVQRLSGARAGEGPVRELSIPDSIWGNIRRDTVHNTYRDTFRNEDFMTRGFISAILEGRQTEPNFHDGARVQRIIDAAIKSHQEGCRVRVDSIV